MLDRTFKNRKIEFLLGLRLNKKQSQIVEVRLYIVVCFNVILYCIYVFMFLFVFLWLLVFYAHLMSIWTNNK